MNILFFGPNGSGKGTQGAILKKKYDCAHIESGAIFRDNIKGGTELGLKAKAYIDKGDLVPDEITIPMILDRLKQDDCKNGWLLDGFPRNKVQAEKLDESLKAEGMGIIMTSHHPEHVLRHAHQLAVIQDHQFSWLGDPCESLTEERLHSLYGIPFIVREIFNGSSISIPVCVPNHA